METNANVMQKLKITLNSSTLLGEESKIGKSDSLINTNICFTKFVEY